MAWLTLSPPEPSPQSSLLLLIPAASASSAAGQETLVGVVGRDFVMLGADSSSSSSIALTASNLDKILVVSDPFPGGRRNSRGDLARSDSGDDLDKENAEAEGKVERRPSPLRDEEDALLRREAREQQAVAVAAAGDAADADRLLGVLAAHAAVREYEAGVGVDVECVFDGRTRRRHGRVGSVLGGEGPVPLPLLGPPSPAGLDAEAIAHLARGEISSALRSRSQLRLCLLVAGMVRCEWGTPPSSRVDARTDGGVDGEANVKGVQAPVQVETSFSSRIQRQVKAAAEEYNSGKEGNAAEDEMKMESSSVDAAAKSKSARAASSVISSHKQNPYLAPRLFWLDEYGSLQDLEYGAHGFGANFALSILDQGYRPDLSREEAADLIRDCFNQLRTRYVINSPQPPCIKCVDEDGCRLVR